MYAIEFYEDSNGVSDVWNFLEKLRIDSSHNKDVRIQYKQVGLCIQLLQDYGTRASSDITKYIGDGIWELRPGSNRVLYFYFENNTFVLLHHFRKKTQKTPKREVEKAKSERNDYIQRKEQSAL